MKLDTKLIVSSSPHIFEGEDVSYAMRQVIYALIPTTLAGIYFFGTHSLLVIIVSIVSAVAWEAISLLIRRKSLSALSDFSAVVTGLLLALTLPPKVPLWIPIVGTAVAIILVKQIFGGLGNNFLNPALVGRAFLLISYPVIMTSWVNPIRTIGNELTSTATSLASTATPIVSTATPLAIDKLKISGYNLPSYFHLCIGDIPGCIGETSVLLLLLGGLWLIYKKVIDWKIPFSFILTVFVISILFGKDPLFQILAGGIFLGAFFMATDWVTTPLTSKGRIIFGIGAGFLTMMIRIFGAYPEECYGILVMNALTPLIDRSFKPRKFGGEEMKDIFTYGITLMLICALAAAALAFTYEKTQKVIELNEAREKEKALKEILSSAKRFVKLENNITPKDPLVNIQEVYIGYDDGEKVGSIWEVSTKGYSSEIKLLVGVDKNNKILEVRVMSQEETPGLGAEVTKEGFLKQFLGKNEPNLEVKRNINPVTGATISSRAVVRAINEVLNHTNFEGEDNERILAEFC